MTFSFKRCLIFLSFLVLSACKTNLKTTENTIVIDAVSGANPWSQLDFNDSSDSFQFAIVTDRTGGLRKGVFEQAINKLNLLQPEFVVSVGDLIEGYTDNRTVIEQQWQEFEGFIDKLDSPFFYLPGNHDITNQVMADVWKKRFGKTHYHFVYKDVLFLMLNSEDPIQAHGKGAIYDEQYDYIKKTLDSHPEAKWTLVFLHQPLWLQKKFDPGRWNDVEKLLQNRKHTVFAGHHHRYTKYERNNGKYFVLSTTGGGNRLRGPNFGEFDHVVWVTMTEEGPIIANLLLEGIWDENVVDKPFKDFMRPFFNGPPLKVSPTLLEGPFLDNAVTQVNFTNDNDVPMHVAYTFTSSKDIGISNENFELTVAPNSVETFTVNLFNKSGENLTQKAPARMTANVTITLEGRPDIKLERTYQLKPDVLQTISKASGDSPTIDGNLSDWRSLPFVVDQPAQITRSIKDHAGPNDASFRFGLKYDDEFVYIGIRVDDDNVISNLEDQTWDQDSVSIRFDARPLKESAQGKGGRSIFKEFQYFGIAPRITAKGKSRAHLPSEWPQGTKISSRMTSTGHETELAIPISYIESIQGKNWTHFRLNVTVDDKDNGKVSRLWWRPDWRSTETYPGSGTFLRR